MNPFQHQLEAMNKIAQEELPIVCIAMLSIGVVLVGISIVQYYRHYWWCNSPGKEIITILYSFVILLAFIYHSRTVDSVKMDEIKNQIVHIREENKMINVEGYDDYGRPINVWIIPKKD